MRSATPHAAGEGPSSAGLFRALPRRPLQEGLGARPWALTWRPFSASSRPCSARCCASRCWRGCGRGWWLTATKATRPRRRPAAAERDRRPSHGPPGGREQTAVRRHRAPRSAPSADPPQAAGAQCQRREGRPWRNREGQAPNAPTGGNHCDCRPGSPASPLAAPGPPYPCSGRSMADAKANVHGKRGPAGPRHKGGRCRLRAPTRCPPPPPAACGPPRGR